MPLIDNFFSLHLCKFLLPYRISMTKDPSMSSVLNIFFNLFKFLIAYSFLQDKSEPLFELNFFTCTLNLNACKRNWCTLHSRVEPVLEVFSSQILLSKQYNLTLMELLIFSKLCVSSPCFQAFLSHVDLLWNQQIILQLLHEFRSECIFLPLSESPVFILYTEDLEYWTHCLFLLISVRESFYPILEHV